MKKRMLALFVAMTLVLAYAVPAVYAAEDEVKTVTVTALPEFQVGASVADAKVTVDAPESVEVKTTWTIYKPGFDPEDEYTAWFPLEGDYLAAHPTFQSDTIYELSLEFDQYVEVAFSDALKQWEGAELWSDGDVYFVNLGRYSDTMEIAKVAVNAPEPAVGETPAVDSVILYDAAGNALPETAVTTDIHWVGYTADREEVAMDGKTFEVDMSYDLVIELAAETGYSFPEAVVVAVNGDEQELTADPKGLSTFASYSLFSPLKSVEIAGMPIFEADENIPAEMEIVNGMGQYSLSVDWYVEGTEYEDQWDDVEPGTTFEAGKTYKAVMWFSSGAQPLADNFYFLIGDQQYAPTEFNPEYNQAVLEYIAKIPADQEGAYDAEDDVEKAPETGDTNTMIPFAVLIAAGAAAIAWRKKAQ